uniref:ATP synthase F0 subunit 8 n=1 Tax=Hestiasula sp. FS-2017 TaxID=2021304 RepID=A0A678QF64_9NEOP|nr:ATP synthase F0 subunit 8 [Hestiasula sp. FS-2017]
MPQMMPLNWLMLFTFFSFLMISFNMMNYYIFINKNMFKIKPKMTTKIMNWKW